MLIECVPNFSEGRDRSVIDRMFHLASLVRDRLSTDSWRILAGIDQRFRAPQGVESMDLTDVFQELTQQHATCHQQLPPPAAPTTTRITSASSQPTPGAAPPPRARGGSAAPRRARPGPSRP